MEDSRLTKLKEQLKVWGKTLTPQQKKDIISNMPTTQGTLYTYLSGNGKAIHTAQGLLYYIESNYQPEKV